MAEMIPILRYRFNRASRRLALVILALLVASLVPSSTQAQEPQDEFGNWLIWNGTVRFSDHWSMFTEAQIRLFEVASNVDEAFVRAAGQYHFNSRALVAAGYLRDWKEPFDKDDPEASDSTEDRIYEQFTISHLWSKSVFEHRYRLEQRWVHKENETTYSNRARYRLQITTPLNKPSMEKGANFINWYNEIFIKLGSDPSFDQNRFYVAGGRQFTKQSNLQVGVLWQVKSSANFYRLQIFYTHNFDLRKD